MKCDNGRTGMNEQFYFIIFKTIYLNQNNIFFQYSLGKIDNQFLLQFDSLAY